MDISVNCMGKISELALKIKEAVDTVEQNKDVCMQIGTSVDRLRVILSLLETTETMKHSTMTVPLKDLEATMARALKLLMDCQENQFSSHIFRAGSLCTELGQVNQEIKDHMNIANIASGVQIVQNSIMLEGSNTSHSNNDTRIEVDGKRKHDLAGSEPFLKGSRDFKTFKFSEMEAATDNFSVENVIGKGGSATVYKM